MFLFNVKITKFDVQLSVKIGHSCHNAILLITNYFCIINLCTEEEMYTIA